MKTAFVLLLIAASTLAYEVLPEKVTFSAAAQAKISAATDNMIAELCFTDQPEPEIIETICLPVAYAAMGEPVTFSANCMACSNADPICMNSCPLFYL